MKMDGDRLTMCHRLVRGMKMPVTILAYGSDGL